MADLLCWNCGASLAEIPLPISRHSNCPKCFEVLHCCRLCRLYKPGRPGDCDHERADPPVIKESANFCDYFRESYNAFSPEDESQQQGAKSEFSALFDDNEEISDAHPSEDDPFTESPPSSGSSNPLDDLFDD